MTMALDEDMSEELVKYMTMLARYSHGTKMVLEHGIPMTEMSPLHADFTRGELGDCYLNAGRATFDHPELRYVEGYAVPSTVPFPMMHAWLVDSEGRIIDPTWEDASAYYGIIIPTYAMREITMRSGYWGVIDNLWINSELVDILEESIS